MARRSKRGIPRVSSSVTSAVAPGVGGTGAAGALYKIDTDEQFVWLRFIIGDKRKPSEIIHFGHVDGRLAIELSGFNPKAGEKNDLYTSPSILRDGERLITSTRKNAIVELNYRMQVSDRHMFKAVNNQFLQLLDQAQRYEQDRTGPPVYLQYKWYDGLNELPPPVFGQSFDYMRIKDFEIDWPGDLHNDNQIIAGWIEGIKLTLTCNPYPEQLKDKAGVGVGGVSLIENQGYLVSRSTTNYIHDPVFITEGQGLTGVNNWSVSSGTGSIAVYENDDPLTPGNWVLSFTADTGGDAIFQTTDLTWGIGGSNIFLSALVGKPDNSAVTTADVEIDNSAIWGADQTDVIEAWRDGWYRIYVNTPSNASPATEAVGLKVKAGKTILLAGYQMELGSTAQTPTYIAHGRQLGSSWSGSKAESTTTRSDGGLYYQDTLIHTALGNDWSIAGWFCPMWTYPSTATSSSHRTIFKYSHGNDYIELWIDAINEQFTLTKRVSGSNYTITDAFTPVYGTWYHVIATQIGTNLYFYINGVEGATSSTVPIGFTATPGASNFFSVGCRNDSITSSVELVSDSIVDGFKVWGVGLNAARSLKLYNNELPIKNDNKPIGMSPFINTSTNNNNVKSFEGNYGVLVGVTGQVAAEVEWHIESSYASPYQDIYIGRREVDESIDPNEIGLFADMQGTADATRSNGQYQDAVLADGNYWTYHAFVDNDASQFVPGRYIALYAANSATNPTLRFFRIYRPWPTTVDGDTFFYTTEQTFSTSGSWKIYNLQDVNIQRYDINLNALTIGVRANADIDGDFVMLLPYPFFKATESSIGGGLTLGANRTLVVNGLDGIVTGIGSNFTDVTMEQRATIIGGPVHAVPNKLNYFWCVGVRASDSYAYDERFTITAWVTPRLLLPGAGE